MMNRLISSLLLVLFVMTPLLAAENGKADPRTISFPVLHFEIPKAERVELDCGMPVFLLRDTELPIIAITAMVRTGSVYVSHDKAGLAGLTGVVMRSGGAGGTAPEKLDDELEFLASSVESSIDSDMGVVSMNSLSRNFDRTLKIFSDVLLHPDFSEKRVDIARKQLIEALRRQNDDPKEIGGREIGKAIYAGHALGVEPTYATVASITRQDLVRFHRRFYRPDNFILAVSGDFDRNDMVRKLNALWGGKVKSSPLVLPEIPQPSGAFSPEVLFAQKNVSQSVIRMGHLGLSKDDPELYAVRLLDYILGGSFTSRLMMEVRTNQGLAYHVASHFDIGRRFTGSFVAETETKGESTIKTINLMRDIIAAMTKEPVTDQELQSSKDYILNSFMFGFTSPASVVMQRARLEFYGYPSDYLETYRQRIGAVSKQELLAAARKYLKPEAFKLVVVGDAAKFEKPLSTFGTVRELELNNLEIKK